MKKNSLTTNSVFQKLLYSAITFSVLAVVISSCSKDDDYDTGNPPVVTPTANQFKAAGDSAAIIGTINQFRSVLGDSLNQVPNKTSGRREVNWDGVPPNLTNNGSFPFDFFNSTDPAVGNGRKRGLVYINTGTSFRVDSTDFSEIEPTYAANFDAFSKKRVFAYLGNNVSEISFKVPGTNTDAFVKGFGLIFSDVDDPNSTTLEFFSGTKSLGVFKAPVRTAAGGFSFLGVYFPDEKITKVKITAGNSILAPGVKDVTDNGTKDLVVMEDFFYNEPLTNN